MSSEISSRLDAVADSLEAKGLIKEAYEIDKVADMIDVANVHPYGGLKIVRRNSGQFHPNLDI